MWETLRQMKWSKVEMGLLGLLAIRLVSILFGRKYWWLVQAMVNVLLGLAYMTVPQYLFRRQVSGGKLGELHVYLLRFMGAAALGDGLTALLTRRSLDERLFASRLYADILGHTALLMADASSAYNMWNKKALKLNEKFLILTGGNHAIHVAGALFYLLRSKEAGGAFQRSGWLTSGLLLDQYGQLIFALLHFAFPSQAIKFAASIGKHMQMKQKFVIDGVHLLITRLMAGYAFAAAISSGTTPSYVFEADKRRHIYGRLTTQVAIFCLDLYGHFVQDMFSPYHVTPFMMAGFYITFLLSLLFQTKGDLQPQAQRQQTSSELRKRHAD